MFIWNVLPPCVATFGAIALVLTVSGPMAALLVVVAAIVVVTMFRLAAAGKPLHHDFADKAAAVDGEMIDVIGNMPVVRAFGGIVREHSRFDATLDRELGARQRSLRYLEKLRLLHAVVTVILTIGLLAWAIVLWQRGAASAGEVVLVCTLGLSVLHATRDLAVALVDVTQHMARLSEALATLLVPHELRDVPGAAPLVGRGARVTFEDISFSYPDGHKIFSNFSLRHRARTARRLDRPIGQRQVDIVRAGPALLRRSGRAHPDRWSGHFPGHAAERARRDIGRAAGHLAVSSVGHGEHPLWPAGCFRRRGHGRQPSPRNAINSSRPCRRALTRSSASGASNCQAVSGSASRSRGRFSRTHRSCCSTRPPRRSTSNPRRRSARHWSALCADGPSLRLRIGCRRLRSSDRIVVLREGRIEQDGPPDKLIQSDGPYRDLIKQEMSRLGKEAA